MRHVVARALVLTLVTAVLGTAGCADEPSAETTSAADEPNKASEAQVYTEVLRRYLGTPSESSLPAKFAAAYVLDRTYANGEGPTSPPEPGRPIEVSTQTAVKAAVADMTRVQFISDRQTVMDRSRGYPEVKAGGILITLGPLVEHDGEVRVAISGYLAPDGGSSLTYVLRNKSGTGWAVTGDTGTRSVS